jgi:predicted dehydrogenase
MERRDFLALGTAGATGAALAMAGAAPGTALAQAQPGRAGGRKLRAGLIGCGWYGMVDLRHLIALEAAEVTALCDADKNHLTAAADEVAKLQGGRRPETFGDFRDMLRPKGLDVVLVGSPDHWHALHAIAAMQAGADVYVQKPISHTVLEGRAMVSAARKLKRVVQVGTQRRSTPHIKAARDFFKEGHLGHVASARVYCYVPMRGNDNPPDAEPPAHLDYDLWTGPAPLRLWNPLVHPKRWRMFSEYANGILGDMGIHMLDLMRWYLGVGYPKKIASSGGIYVEKQGKFNVTDTQTVTYDYGDLVVTWEHRSYGPPADPKYVWGVSFYGDKGSLSVSLDHWDFTPRAKDGKPVHQDAVREPDPTKLEGDHVRPAGRAHMKDFVDAIASRGRPIADIEEGHVSTALCLMGNIAQKVGRTLTLDPKGDRFVGDEEANRLLRRAYRKPWIYPAV